MAIALGTETMELRLATASGYTARTILSTPAWDASSSEIPIIDISLIFSDSLAARQTVARKFHSAARHSGFFYIRNHGIPSEVTEEAYAACLDFFRQDMDLKKESLHNGYCAPDTERINADEGIDICESYDITYDPRIDSTIANLATIPKEASQYFLPGAHPWEHTENLPYFKAAIVRYFQACLVLARAMTRSFALSLDLAEDFFDSKVQYPAASFSLKYYPPIPAAGRASNPRDPNARQSIGSHTDWQLFTILWQDNNGGLQVLSPEGQWINAPPMEGTLVVNVADYMQRMTNDRYISAVHRVRNLSDRERVSIPFFWGFGLHQSCDVLESCLEEGEKKKYEAIKCVDWLRLRTSYMIDLKNDKER
ncbi:MAG: hypothetical protein M1836_001153 [Candelina mexicana]|nr:MAG: hypothetical protein M1836_001153 [Candelina mexicana]